MTDSHQRRSLERPASAEIEIKHSRFLALVAPVRTEQQARQVIAERRAEHPKARHHCSAFVLGPEPTVQRSNDDGEPSGTAGVPILDVLTGHGLTDVVAVVTRYFGGTLLGAGGLVRAYGGAVSAALDGARLVTRRLLVPVTVTLDYATAEAVRARVAAAGWQLVGQEFSAQVTITVAAPASELESVLGTLADLSAGAAQPVVGEPAWF